ncbi:MAG: hypothetical protein JWM63_5458 [Gammaproteobacteria bacterium]|nr:hypothetical protein [Gammaproteobacteria bacterium]
MSGHQATVAAAIRAASTHSSTTVAATIRAAGTHDSASWRPATQGGRIR